MRIGQKTDKFNLILLFTVIYALFVAGCSSSPKYPAFTTSKQNQHKIITIAKAQLGKPYRYGGRNPKTGFDCSGLINYSYNKAGLAIPRTTHGLYQIAQPVKRNHLKAGDLVFFRINRKKISHVGLYLGDNRFIHAPSGGKTVNIASLNDKYWQKRFIRGGRI